MPARQPRRRTPLFRAHQARPALAVMITAALLWVVWPYIGAVFWSVVLAIVFAPLYRWLWRLTRGRRTVAALSTLVVIVLGVGIPLTVLGAVLLRQAGELYGAITSGRISFGTYLQRIADALPPWAWEALQALGLGDSGAVRDRLSESAITASRFLASHLLGIGLNMFSVAISLAIMLYLLHVLLADGPALTRRIERFSPLPPEETRSLGGTFAIVIRATVKGGVVMAATQGLLGGVVLGLLGIETPLFWGFVFGLLSMIPAVGAGLLWAPIALYFLLTGAVWKGIVLILFGAVVLTVVDNVLRPILVGRDTQLPGYLVLVTTLGGIATFGPNGLVIGPVIAALFIAIWNLFGAVDASSASSGSQTDTRERRSPDTASTLREHS